MHACGNDGHITVGLGTAKLLCQMREQLHGTVKFIFQPAEEGVRGARAIVENGHLEDVDFLLAAHMYGGSEQHPCGICITGSWTGYHKAGCGFSWESIPCGGSARTGK